AGRADGEDKERSGVPQPLAPLRGAGGVVDGACGREAPTRQAKGAVAMDLYHTETAKAVAS
ncbi:MAG: hypothetical protein ACRDWA_10400, partial [Acidimicrobiia bacterium]